MSAGMAKGIFDHGDRRDVALSRELLRTQLSHESTHKIQVDMKGNGEAIILVDGKKLWQCDAEGKVI